MTGTNDRDDRLDSALAAGDPVAGGELDRLPSSMRATSSWRRS